jgi:Arsenical resistance operon protein ArsD
MKTQTVQIFDPAMCCSSGVCGPDVDPKLVQFAADLDWLKGEGVMVQRHNLSQSPAAFAENALVRGALEKKGEAALPLMIVNGKVAVSGHYPKRNELGKLLKLKIAKVARSSKSSCCCGGDC